MINHSAQIINIYKLSSSRVPETASCIERQVSLKVVPILLEFACEHDLVLVYNHVKIRLPSCLLIFWQSVATQNYFVYNASKRRATHAHTHLIFFSH